MKILLGELLTVKPCLIKQPAGIGDVFFCQKIARVMMEKGYDIYGFMTRYSLDSEIYQRIWFPMTTDDFPMKDIYFRGAGAVVEENGHS